MAPQSSPNNLTTPPVTSASSSGQPSIRNFLRSGGIRQAVASAFDLPQVRGAEGGAPFEDNYGDMEVDTHNDSQNRKRLREENNQDSTSMDDDDDMQTISDSMIANTSIEQSVRRRRTSSTNPGLLETPLTSSPQVLQLLAEINQDTQDKVPLIPEEGIRFPVVADDSSTQSNLINIRGMVEGINAIVKDAVHYDPPAGPRMEWDDTGMVPSLPHLSPRPRPRIAEDPPEDLPVEASGSAEDKQEKAQNETTDIVTCLRQQFNQAIDAACIRIASLTDDKLANIKREVCTETEQRMSNIEEEIKSSNEELDAKIVINKERLEAQEAVLQSISNTLSEVEPNIQSSNLLVNQHTDALQEQSENIDRLEQAVHILQRNSSPPDQNMQALLERITALEKAKDEAAKTIEQLKTDRERQDDFFFLRTISFRRFLPQNSGSYRAMATRILATIGCEDIMANVETISFSNKRDNMRLTFPSIQSVNDAVHWLAEGIKYERANGGAPSLEFMVMTPPRFSEERKILTRIGTELKKAGQCRRFTFMIQGGKLKMRLIKPGSRDKIIEAPHDEAMDTESNDNTCPICQNPFSRTIRTSIYGCGHSFHSSCLDASLENDLKCPVCRIIPEFPIPTEILQKCGECVNSGFESRETLCVSAKCNHLHTIACHHAYLREHDIVPPSPVQTVEDLRLTENFIGCRTCSEGYEGSPPTPMDLLLIHAIMGDNIPAFINLENNRPWNKDGPPFTLSGLTSLPLADNHDPDPRDDNVATGANATPIGNRDRSPHRLNRSPRYRGTRRRRPGYSTSTERTGGRRSRFPGAMEERDRRTKSARGNRDQAY